ELLRHCPVEAFRVSLRDRFAVELDSERNVEGPVAASREVLERGRFLVRCLDTCFFEQRERRHPCGDRRLERLAEERAKWDVLPRLDVAGAPVVDEDDAEDVLGEGLNGHRLAELAADADDEAELELEV